ncbi:MAG: hypothetical protein ACJ74B_04615 [Gaiellaceae bacterium]
MRHVLRLALALGAVCLLAAVSARPVESTHLKIIVGVTDDTAKWMVRQDGIVGVHKDLRLMAVRVTVPWRPGQAVPTKLQQVYLTRIRRMTQLNERVVLAVYNTAQFAPTTRKLRNEYCGFVRGIVRRVPLIHDVEVWNEANSPAYWPAAAGAEAYAKLLARCYDVLHARAFPINVVSSTASRHDPAGFIFELGDALRDLGRTRQLFDTFGHNPYGESSAEPPSALHADLDMLGEGDYETLMNVLHTTFDDTAQPVPGERGVTIWYVEDGFQTVPAPDKLRYYRGRENDRSALPAVAKGAVDQASQLHDAILLAYCQPNVSGFFNFGLLDEDRLGGWQAGLLWRDGSRKPSYDTFKALIAEVRRRDTDCSKIRGAPQD